MHPFQDFTRLLSDSLLEQQIGLRQISVKLSERWDYKFNGCMIAIERSDGMIIIPLSALHGSHDGWKRFRIQACFSAIARTLLNHY